MELVTDLLFVLCVILDTRFTGGHSTDLESSIAVNAALPLKAEPLPHCSFRYLLCGPDGLAQIPACLCVLASSTADPLTLPMAPLSLLVLAACPPDFSGMRLPGMCKALRFVRGHRNTLIKLLFRIQQGENLPIHQPVRDPSDYLPPFRHHTLTVSWH